ncbi:MAG: glycosyltransferase family 2 protein [Cyanobacteria bacterium SIG28]|nr:glycosyltransferase family 2 protein [Cyanobacteria bacterium SIG28]
MEDKPLISVVLPTYNGSEFISQAINSIINQTYTNWELIIVNDCSTDNTAEIIQTFAQKDSRIRVLTNEVNKKLPASLNVGFKQAQGEYYTWTSDDNEYYPQAFEKMVDFLQNNDDYGMVHAICRVEGCVEKCCWGYIATTPITLLEFPTVAACFLYKASIAKSVGNYDESCFYMEDHDFWLRFLLNAPIGIIPEELYMYRRHEASLTVKSGDIAAKKRLLLTLKYLPSYKENFPQSEDMLNYKYGLLEVINNEDDINYEILKKQFSTKTVYKQLKQIYKLKKSNWQLKRIKSLGFIYFLKAVELKYKYGVEK